MSPLALDSRRLSLRPVQAPDCPGLLQVFRDAGVRRFLLDDQRVSREWVDQEIASSEQLFARCGTGLWAIRKQGQDAIAGFSGFREFFEPPRLQLLYGLLPTYWGQGLALEAARLVCDHAFGALGFTRIEAAMDTPNTASQQLARRLGMTPMRTPSGLASDTLFFEMFAPAQ